MFTGLYPRSHGVNDRDHGLPPEAITLAEILSAHGYETAAFFTNANIDAKFGLSQGFDDFTYLAPPTKQIGSQTSDEVNNKVFAWLDEHKDLHHPFFLYVHTTDPHSPYTPPPRFRRKPRRLRAGVEIGSNPWMIRLHKGQLTVEQQILDDMAALYDDEIRFNDHSFGLLLEKLKGLDLYEDMIIFVVSDHGEEFYERGLWEHGKTLHGEVLQIPLIMKLPADRPVAGMKVEVLAQHIDIPATILDYLDLGVPTHMEGSSLLASISAGNELSRSAFSYLALDGIYMASIVNRPWKLILRNAEDLDAPWLQLYNLERDPKERSNVLNQHPVLGGYLFTRMKDHLVGENGAWKPVEIPVDEQLAEKLKALGYVH